MKLVNYTDLEPVLMNNEIVKNVAGRVLIGKDDQANNFCMRLFEIDKEGFTPRHTHEWEHEIFVHSGNGEIFIDGDWHPMSAGSAVFVPPNADHQIRNNSDGMLTFICLIPAGAPEL